MASVATYLNFPGTTEAAFTFYKGVFGTEITNLVRFGDIPAGPGQPDMSDTHKHLVMNVQLPIIGGHLLMGTDEVEGLGDKLVSGNNFHIVISPDSRAEADRLGAALADGGTVRMPLQETFWGAYYGQFTDKFGVQWMINCETRE